jgi:catechol 2,3-dioxygenase-like lactoylglutathione lyase family enzyme
VGEALEGLLHGTELLGRGGQPIEGGLHVLELGQHGLELDVLGVELAADGAELVARWGERVHQVPHELHLLARHDPSELALERGELVARQTEAPEHLGERVPGVFGHGGTVPWHAVAVPVIGFDHLVLNVADVHRSLDFYVGTLGLTPERVEAWEAGEVFFPSVRIDARTIIDLMRLERSGDNVDHLCLVVDDDIEALAARDDLVIEEGPVDRWGAQGTARSVYLRDPDGNLVELRRYPG